MNFDRYHIVYEERILERRYRVCVKNSMEISFNPPANTRRISNTRISNKRKISISARKILYRREIQVVQL